MLWNKSITHMFCCLQRTIWTSCSWNTGWGWSSIYSMFSFDCKLLIMLWTHQYSHNVYHHPLFGSWILETLAFMATCTRWKKKKVHLGSKQDKIGQKINLQILKNKNCVTNLLRIKWQIMRLTFWTIWRYEMWYDFFLEIINVLISEKHVTMNKKCNETSHN
jgi:hypothetical protein